MLIRCPVCGDRHRVNDNYDNQDIICLNTANRRNQRTFQDQVPEDLLTRDGVNFNSRSTRVNEARAATVNISRPDFNGAGEKISSTKKRNW